MHCKGGTRCLSSKIKASENRSFFVVFSGIMECYVCFGSGLLFFQGLLNIVVFFFFFLSTERLSQ